MRRGVVKMEEKEKLVIEIKEKIELVKSEIAKKNIILNDLLLELKALDNKEENNQV